MGKEHNLRTAPEALDELKREIDRFLPVIAGLKGRREGESPSCRG